MPLVQKVKNARNVILYGGWMGLNHYHGLPIILCQLNAFLSYLRLPLSNTTLSLIAELLIQKRSCCSFWWTHCWSICLSWFCHSLVVLPLTYPFHLWLPQWMILNYVFPLLHERPMGLFGSSSTSFFLMFDVYFEENSLIQE